MQRDIDIFELIEDERERQELGIELIASENFVSDQVMEAAGSVLTNKYAEGYPGKRYYGGCEVIDEIEQIAIDRAKALFGAEYANVQPHSGSQANAAVYATCLKPGDKILGFDLSHGGHLTHGSPVNFSGRLYEPVFYGVEKETGRLNYDNILEIAKHERPKMIVAGASAYSRDIDFKRFREIADEVGAILFFHISGKQLILLESILACIISPCAAAAAVVTLKLGGNLEQMTTYTFLSNLLCVLLIPVCFPLIEPASQMTFWGAFSLIMQKVCLVLVVPMLLALLTKSLPQLRRFHQWLIHIPDLSFYLWGCSLMIVTGTTLKNIFHAGTSVLFLLLIGFSGLVLCLLQYAVGRYIGRFFGTSIESGQGLGQKNTAFAIWIAATYLHPLSTVGPGCYILWQNIINSIEIWKKGKYKA